jgi:hypothetical protein
MAMEHDGTVMKMNGVLRRASGRVQCFVHNVGSMIDRTDHPDGDLQIISLREETTMLKTISVALLAASVIAAPALAATGKADEAKAKPVKTSVLNANAKMGTHHTKHVRHHSQHKSKKMSAIKSAPKIAHKGAATAAKHG